ncbi:MAG: rhodanese-like domain-containing protein [bacterium]
MEKKLSGPPFVLCIVIVAAFIMILYLSLHDVEAFTLITAQEAYTMLSTGEADLLDVRTLEEYTFVGSPALEAGGEPPGYLIPWKLFGGLDDNGQVIYKDNPDFDALVEQTFGSNKDRALIVMCAVGIRSTAAARRLEQRGFTRVYEIDNKLRELTANPGGHGGFQGANYLGESGAYNGYRGYPGRLPAGPGPASIKVAIASDLIEHENDSVSWMDTGLPVTQKIDPKKIPKLKKTEPGHESSASGSGNASSSISCPASAYPNGQSIASSLPLFGGSPFQALSYSSAQFPSFQSLSWYQSPSVKSDFSGTGYLPTTSQPDQSRTDQSLFQNPFQNSPYQAYLGQSQYQQPVFLDLSSFYPVPKRY